MLCDRGNTYAPPSFLLTLVALVHFLRPCPVQCGRKSGALRWDDKSSWKLHLAFPNKIVIPTGASRSGGICGAPLGRPEYSVGYPLFCCTLISPS
jgi:hypothetical protein